MIAEARDEAPADPCANAAPGRAMEARAFGRVGAERSRPWRLATLVLVAAVLVFLCAASLLLGARTVALPAVMDAVFSDGGTSAEHLIIRDYRLPRTLLALLCGAAFGVSGALIQAATRNPLADPGILGVNAGAAFFVTLAVGVFGLQSVASSLWFAFAGAIAITLLVYAAASRGRDGATPLRLVLSGVALSAVLSGIGSSLSLLNPQTFDALRSWSMGSVAGRNMEVVGVVAPFILSGLGLALALARPLNALALGADLSRSLGANIVRTRLLVVVAVTLLSGAATAAVGPIGFVGLMVPHAVRWFSGPDQRWIVAFTILCAPGLLLAADILGRLLLFPGELEVGLVTAFLGAPVLVALARRTKAHGL